MTPSRNAPCPCGSGKLFKRCHGLEPDKRKKGKDVIGFFEAYSKESLLSCLSGLALYPANHGKNIRLELLVREALTSIQKKGTLLKRDDLALFLSRNFLLHSLEDPTGNLFTEPIFFEGGDYLIFPGITESSAFVLNKLLSAIYLWPNRPTNKGFRDNCYLGISLMLGLSDIISKRLGYSRYMAGVEGDSAIKVPDNATLASLRDAVIFTEAEMDTILEAEGIDPAVLPYFMLTIEEEGLNEYGEDLVLRKPIIHIDGKYIVHSPTSISYALAEFIWEQADSLGSKAELESAYHGLIWNHIHLQLRMMDFKPLKLNDEAEILAGSFTIVARIDTDKIAIIRYTPFSKDTGPIDGSDSTHQVEQLIEMLRKDDPSQVYMVLTIVGLVPGDFILVPPDITDVRTIEITSYDFDILANSKECKALDLWKFIKARTDELPAVAYGMLLTTLDQFAIYKEHEESFYLTDQKGLDISIYRYGASVDFEQKVKLLADEHTVFLGWENFGKTSAVIKKDKYAPIYLIPMSLNSGDLEFEVEGFPQSVWVRPEGRVSGTPLQHICWELNDALAYWLWQFSGFLSPFIKPLTISSIGISYNLVEPAKFATISKDFTRDPAIYDKLFVEATEISIILTISPDILPYLYGDDNEGDRILVRYILIGINALLRVHHLEEIPGEAIEKGIRNIAPLGMKKKLFILNTIHNPLLDPQYLVTLRFVQDYDVSVVLNAIPILLGKKLPPEGLIPEDKRKSFVITLVVKALLPYLKMKIRQYDSRVLIEWLIGLNETVIRKREDFRLKTPTRMACFESEEHEEDQYEMNGKINQTSLAVRCLLEHLAAEPWVGEQKVSMAGVDELLGIMDQICSWGTTGDLFDYKPFQIEMGILPTGRVGTGKQIFNKVLRPYFQSKTREDIEDASDFFHQMFPSDEGGGEEDDKPVSGSIDKAFIAEYGISFSRICWIIGALSGIAFNMSTPYAVLSKADLFKKIKEFDSFSTAEEFEKGLLFLTLTNRASVEDVPDGYDHYDINPWRFSRRLSLLRKPIIAVPNDAEPGNPYLFWGARQVLVSRITMAEQLYYDRFKATDGGPVKTVASKLSNKRGAEVVKRTLENLHLPNTVLDSEVTIAPGGKLKNDKNIGDVDVLLIDKTAGLVYSLECKSFAPSRNIKEMIEECGKLMGSVSEIGYIERHERRDAWLKGNLSALSIRYGLDLTGYVVKSIFVTQEDMLFPYLKDLTHAMPFVSLYELRSGGISCLEKASAAKR